jgi:hypothetical protein
MRNRYAVRRKKEGCSLWVAAWCLDHRRGSGSILCIERLRYRVASSGERMHSIRVEDAVLAPTLGITLRRLKRLIAVICHRRIVGQNIEVLIGRREV